MRLDTNEIKSAFMAAARLARVDLDSDHVEVQLLPAPHRPPTVLPSGQQAVYCFSPRERLPKGWESGRKDSATIHQPALRGDAPITLAKSIIKNRSRMRSLVAEAGYREVSAGSPPLAADGGRCDFEPRG